MTYRKHITGLPASGPTWWPFSLAFTRGHAGLARVRQIWAAAVVLAIALAVFEAIVDLSGIPVSIASVGFSISIYPPLVLTVCLALWLGPVWGAIPAWSATFVSGLIAGMTVPVAALFATATPLEVMILWGSFVILDLPPDLPRWRHVFAFFGVVIVASTASSLAGLLYIDSRQLDLIASQRIWEGWVIGDVLQLMLVGVPLLHWVGPRARAWIGRHFDTPPRFAVSFTRSVMLSAALIAVLVLVVFQGVWRVTLSLDIPPDARTITGELLLPRLREMGLFVGLLVAVTFATTTAFAAALARLGERERGVSQRDPLTGALNRRSFGPHFQREAERSQRLGKGISLLFIDVDHFKALNDTWGHELGDQVLRQLANRIQGTIREHDLLFRWGGEEFVVLLPHTPEGDAALLADRMRVAIAAEPLVRELVPEPLHVAVSIGAAGLEGRPFEVDQLLARADRALYRAKSEGRDRVVVGE
ncbi:MAG TPA: GGDEF domain-containing protein [Gemmatimonadales bacterium]|nr:GGDEF domain-containing protein [Gemmatimonadales bacterium]